MICVPNLVTPLQAAAVADLAGAGEAPPGGQPGGRPAGGDPRGPRRTAAGGLRRPQRRPSAGAAGGADSRRG